MLAVEDDPQAEVVPLRDHQLGVVAAHPGGDRLPPAAGGGHLLEGQPAPVADLDGVAALVGGEQPEDPLLEEGGVHAELQGHAPAEAAPQVLDDLAQERHGLFGVVHVAGTVLDPEDVAGLGDVREQGVVAGIFAVMGVEAAERPADRAARSDHRAVDVDREARELQACERVGYQVAIEGDEGCERLLRELAEPVGHGATRGQTRKPAEARDERITGRDSAGAPSGARRHRTGPGSPGRVAHCHSRCAGPPRRLRNRAIMSICRRYRCNNSRPPYDVNAWGTN